jgi:hypothetical protein
MLFCKFLQFRIKFQTRFNSVKTTDHRLQGEVGSIGFIKEIDKLNLRRIFVPLLTTTNRPIRQGGGRFNQSELSASKSEDEAILIKVRTRASLDSDLVVTN